MLRYALIGICLVALGTIAPQVRAQSLETSVVGTWKLKSFTRKDLATGNVTHFLGETPTGYIIYTPGRRVFAFLVGSNRKAPERPEPTDAERADLFRSMIGYTGTYRIVDGNKIAVRADASWIQSWTGVERTQQAEVVGNLLTIFSTVTAPSDGSRVLVSNVWERVE